MTPTPVGMRCPECSAEKTRVVVGAGTGSGEVPIATYVLMGISILGYLFQIVTGGGGLSNASGPMIYDYGLFGPSVAAGEWYRLITSTFLHAGIMHLAFNMFALYITGNLLEPAIGRMRFVSIYIASMLAGSLGVMVLEPNALSIGASGAVFGLFAAAFVIAKGRRLEQIASQLGFLIVANLLFTFAVPNIAIGAHLFGAAGGAIAALIVILGERGRLGHNHLVIEMVLIWAIAIGSLALSIYVA